MTVARLAAWRLRDWLLEWPHLSQDCNTVSRLKQRVALKMCSIHVVVSPFAGAMEHYIYATCKYVLLATTCSRLEFIQKARRLVKAPSRASLLPCFEHDLPNSRRTSAPEHEPGVEWICCIGDVSRRHFSRPREQLTFMPRRNQLLRRYGRSSVPQLHMDFSTRTSCLACACSTIYTSSSRGKDHSG
jgi:hypothetical protein